MGPLTDYYIEAILALTKWRPSALLTCRAEFMKQVFPRLVNPHTPGCPLYESCSSEFLLHGEPKNQEPKAL